MNTFLGGIFGIKEDREARIFRVTMPSKLRNSDMISDALGRIADFESMYGSNKKIQARKKSLLKKLYSLAP
jgi:hypothetical protein